MAELISVIIPVYNTEKYLEKNIESAVNQSYADLELLYIDDGSTDSSPEILAAWAQKDPRIRVIPQKNQGVSAARNTGLREAKGTYITFLDADDYLDKDYVQALWEQMAENVDITCCGYMLHRPDAEILIHDSGELFCWNQQDALVQLLEGSRLDPGVCAKLYRAEILKDLGFVPGLRYTEDYLFNLLAFGKSRKVSSREKAYYHYILHSNSATTGAPVVKRERDVVFVAETAAQMPFDSPMREMLQQKMYLGYLSAYNSLLYSSGEEVTALKKELRQKILENRAAYREIPMGPKLLFYYWGIRCCPGVYPFAYRTVKRLLPDRRVFRI